MPTTRPTVTDEHRKKYETIMGTPVKSNSTPAPVAPAVQIDNDSSVISSLLASLPKVKDIGNKMFIFTGKKKIIMDGAQRKIEDIKTVDAKPPPEKENDKIKDAPEKVLPEKDLVAKNIPTEVLKSKDGKKTIPELNKTPAPKIQADKNPTKRKLPTALLAAITALFFIGWIFFWLVFLGYVKF